MGNPYKSPGVPTDQHPAGPGSAVPGKVAATRSPRSLCVLLVLFTLTVVMAMINLVQEDSGSGASVSVSAVFATLMIAGFSGLSQVPGLLIAGWRWKGSSNSVLPMLFAAYIIALTGVAFFALFVSQTEPSDSMNSAAHMHIFLFPAIHLLFSTVLYLIAFLCTMGLVGYSHYRRRRLGMTGRVNDGASGSEDLNVDE